MMKMLIFISIITLLTACNVSGDSPEEKELFGKIKNGMAPKAVIDFLGKPDTIIQFSDSTYSYQYFTRNKSAMRSIMPTVSFSNDTVSSVAYSE